MEIDIFGALEAQIGSDGVVLLFTLLFVVADFATGLCKAAAQGDVQSSKLRQGLWHKCGYFAVIILACLIEGMQAYSGVFVDFPTVGVVCGYICLTEAASIYENACVLSPEIAKLPISKWFKETIDNDNQDGAAGGASS
jgi:phage-related holin